MERARHWWRDGSGAVGSETVGRAVGRSLRTAPSLPPPQARSRSYVLARSSLRALHLDLACGCGLGAACEATDRPRMATEPRSVLGAAPRWQEGARSLPPKDGQSGTCQRVSDTRRCDC